jgi:L-2,4-diaminobutyrate decarboxylase
MKTPLKSINKAYNPTDFREKGVELVNLLADYLEDCEAEKPMPILPKSTPNEMLSEWEADFQSPSETNPTNFFKKILSQSNHIHHPHYAGHQVVPSIPIAVLSETLSAFLNNGMAVYEMGPASTAIERIVCNWIAKKFGMDEKASGLLVSGGSLGNLTALLCARQAKVQNAWQGGLKKVPQLAIMVSEEAHYCVARSAKIMGLGEDGVILVPANSNRQMNMNALERKYEEAISAGKQVFAIVGSACTTSTGSYDPLPEIADFCEKNDIWFHVDGAHGSAVALSEKYKHLVVGIERADSVIIDFHKMLLMPALTTAVVFKNELDSHKTFAQKASYLLEESENNWFDLASRTVECTKKMMGLKIYLTLKMYGEQLFDDFVTHTHDLAQEFAESIKSNPNLELAIEPQSNILCFRFFNMGSSDEELNQLNRNIRREIVESGEFYIVQTQLNDIVYLRMALMNPQINSTIFEKLLKKIEQLAVLK